MQVELCCPLCHGRLDAEPCSPTSKALGQLTEEGPWAALGDGETVEDHLFTTLTSQESLCCPKCGIPVTLSEDSLGQLAMEMLSSW